MSRASSRRRRFPVRCLGGDRCADVRDPVSCRAPAASITNVPRHGCCGARADRRRVSGGARRLASDALFQDEWPWLSPEESGSGVAQLSPRGKGVVEK